MTKTLRTNNRKALFIVAGIMAVMLSWLSAFVYLNFNGLLEFEISRSLYSVESLYFIYLIFLFLVCCASKRYNAVKMSIIYFSFLILFICSSLGPDYIGYRYIYNSIADGVSHSDIHGEILYYLFNKIASGFMSYDMFRVCYLGVFLALFMYSIYKLSPNPAIVFLMSYCGLLVYLISAYRQFATIAILFYSIYLIYRNKKIRPCILTALSTFIHGGGIVCLFIILLLLFLKSNDRNLRKYGTLIILVAVVARIFLARVLSIGAINNFIARITSYSEVKIFSMGFLSRMFELAVLFYLYKRIPTSKFEKLLFKTYFICMILYVACPLEFLMARLFICARFLCILLITLMANPKSEFGFSNSLCYKRKINYRLVLGIFVCLYIVLFVYQLLFQSGYTMYRNFLFL